MDCELKKNLFASFALFAFVAALSGLWSAMLESDEYCRIFPTTENCWTAVDWIPVVATGLTTGFCGHIIFRFGVSIFRNRWPPVAIFAAVATAGLSAWAFGHMALEHNPQEVFCSSLWTPDAISKFLGFIDCAVVWPRVLAIMSVPVTVSLLLFMLVGRLIRQV